MKLDIASVFGMVLGFGMVGIALYMASEHDFGQLMKLYVKQPDAWALAVGGSLGGTICSAPWHRAMALGKMFNRVIFYDPKNGDYSALITEMTDYATEARRNGVLALDAKTDEIQDPFIKNGIQLAVDGTAPDQIEEILHKDIESMAKRHEMNQAMILKWAELAPAFGLVGTLSGLIAALANMADASKIGPALALAFVCTLYGAMVANMLCIPFAAKLKARTVEEITRKEMILDGILAIQNGDNPRIVKQRLMSYVPMTVRETLVDEAEAS